MERKVSSVTNGRTPFRQTGTGIAAGSDVPPDIRIVYHRLGSVGPGPDHHMVDRVELQCFGGESRVELFFDMYHVEPSSFVPQGLSMGTVAGLGLTRGRVMPFPEGLDEYDPSIK